jgi:hypothetical protein
VSDPNHPDDTEENSMNEEADSPNARIIEAEVPGDTINIVPSSLWFAYEVRDGFEAISILCEDANHLGHFRIVLGPEDAAELARGLARVSGPQLAQLRAVYAARQAEQ